MHKCPIPSSGEALPVISCGTWRTFDVGDDAARRRELAEVLRMLFAAGGSVIDSSPMYGLSETVAGALLAEMGAQQGVHCHQNVDPEAVTRASRRWKRRCASSRHHAST